MGYIIRDEMIRPILIGGIICGILSYKASFVPIIDYLNCCCLFDILSGVITARLMTKEFDPSDRDYMIAGGLSGALTGFISWLIVSSIFGATIPFMTEPYLKEIYIMIIRSPLFNIFSILMSIIESAIFGAVGGVLYKKLKRP